MKNTNCLALINDALHRSMFLDYFNKNRTLTCHTAGVVPDHGDNRVHELNRNRGPSFQEIMMESQDTRVVLFIHFHPKIDIIV